MTSRDLCFHTFRRYKTYVAFFVSWLGKVARETGLVGGIFGDSPVSTKGKKGKAKAQSKGNKGKTHEVHFEKFVPLAKAIAEADGMEVPKSIIWALRSLIHYHLAHESYGTIHREPIDSDAEGEFEEDACDSAGISDILKQVLELLEPKSAYATETEPKYQADRVVSLAEIVEQLKLSQEKTGAGVSQWVPEHIARTAASNKPDSYVLAPECYSTEFAIYCFLHDFIQLRLHVSKTWSDYKKRKISLVTASLTMNAAMELVEKINQDLIADFPELDTHRNVLDLLNIGGVMETNVANLEYANVMDTNDGIPQTITPKAFGCAHTFELLQSYISKYLSGLSSQKVQGIIMYPYFIKALHKDVFRFPQTPDEKALVRTVMQIIVAHALRPHNRQGYMHDKIFHAVDIVGPNNWIPPWAVLAFQLFFDTRRTLEDDPERAYREWNHVSRWVLRALEACMATIPDENGTINPSYRSLMAPLKAEIQKRAPRDEYGELMSEYYEKDVFAKNKFTIDPYVIMKNHPMHAGLQLADFLENLHAKATLLYDKQPVVMMVAHLYTAAHHSGLLPNDVQWEELEAVLTKQGTAHEYRFTTPPDPKDWVKHYLVACGCDEKALKMIDARGESVLEALACHPKKPTPSAHMVQAADVVWPAANGHKRTEAGRNFGEKLEQLVDRYLQRHLNDSRGAAGSAPPRLPLAPQNTLAAFTKAVQDDELILHFDPLAFHCECLELLRRIQIRVANDNPLFTPLAGDVALEKMVGLLLHLRATAADPKDPSTGFAEACRLLQEHIVERGGKLLDAAYLRTGLRPSSDKVVLEKPKWSDDMCRPEDFIDMDERTGLEDGVMRWNGWIVELDSAGNLHWIVEEGIDTNAPFEEQSEGETEEEESESEGEETESGDDSENESEDGSEEASENDSGAGSKKEGAGDDDPENLLLEIEEDFSDELETPPDDSEGANEG